MLFIITVSHTSTCYLSLQYPTHPHATCINHYSVPHIHMLFIITVSHTSTCYLSLQYPTHPHAIYHYSIPHTLWLFTKCLESMPCCIMEPRLERWIWRRRWWRCCVAWGVQELTSSSPTSPPRSWSGWRRRTTTIHWNFDTIKHYILKKTKNLPLLFIVQPNLKTRSRNTGT